MVYPCTVEDSERDEVFDNDMNMIDTFLDLIGDEEMFDDKTRKDVASTFASTNLSLSIDNTNDTERIGYMRLSLSSSPTNATNNDVLSVAFYELKVKFS